MKTNRNKLFEMCSEVEAGNFTTLAHSVLHSVGKSLLKVTETLWKNGLIIAKDVWMMHVNFTVTACTYSENKKWRHYIRTAHRGF
jgi:hypothetical protein